MISKKSICMTAAFLLLAGGAGAQTYPARPIRFITVSAPGTVGDIIPRVVGQELAARLKQPVVVENRPGGSGLVGATAGARSAPDGYNLLLATSGTMIVNTFVYSKMPFDSLKDFEPVALVASVPLVLVVDASSQVKTFRDLMNLAKSRPGAVSYGSLGNGSTANISAAILKKAEGVDMIQVPYKGTTDALKDIFAGRLTTMFDFIGTSLPHIRSGKLRALAVARSTRLGVLPDVPSMAELGYPGFDTTMFYGAYVPAGTPRAIVERLGEEFRAVLGTASVREKFAAIVVEPGELTGERFADYQKAQFGRWKEIIKSLDIPVE
jgi:tripartite-type tricarboxylate transporter receptor subunit TctC